MDEHPLVRFHDGPGGRRAALLGTGLDVAEMITTIRDNGSNVRKTARYLEIPLAAVQAAVAYYGAYRAEIDEQIALAVEEANDAQAAWVAGQAALAK